ncbi:hypothetical protein DNTS_005389, partial [Danionella cerebrum]
IVRGRGNERGSSSVDFIHSCSQLSLSRAFTLHSQRAVIDSAHFCLFIAHFRFSYLFFITFFSFICLFFYITLFSFICLFFYITLFFFIITLFSFTCLFFFITLFSFTCLFFFFITLFSFICLFLFIYLFLFICLFLYIHLVLFICLSGVCSFIQQYCKLHGQLNKYSERTIFRNGK